MKKIIIIAAMILGIQSLFAQDEYTREPWKINTFERLMDSYSAEPDAPAIAFYETCNTVFEPNSFTGRLNAMSTVRVKIKILKEEGLKYATFDIPYYVSDKYDEEIVETIKGQTTVIKNGQLVAETKLAQKDIEDIKIDKNNRIKRVTLPDVQVGSIIEYEYLIRRPFLEELREWHFQQEIPVMYSRYEIWVVPYYQYVYLLKGPYPFDENYHLEPKSVKLRWGNLVAQEIGFVMSMSNLPSFKDSDFITRPEDVMSSLVLRLAKTDLPKKGEVDIISTWSKINNDLLKDKKFGKYITASEKEAKNILNGLNLKGLSKDESIEAITEYVRNNYQWDGESSLTASKTAGQFIKDKTGNSADINLFLLALLKEAGIDAYPVALSTRDHGVIFPAYAFPDFLNYVIVRASGTTDLLLDATNNESKYNWLPERCANTAGLLVEKGYETWINVQDDNLRLTEHVGIPVGNEFGIGEQPSFKLSDHFQEIPQENIFKEENRILPVDMIYRRGESYSITIEIPKGYTVQSKPEDRDYNGKMMEFNYKTTQKGNTLLIEADYAFKKSIYPAAEYPVLRATYEALVKLLNEPIVLIKE